MKDFEPIVKDVEPAPEAGLRKKSGHRMKKVRIEDAVGTVLAHDMTRIVPGKVKEVGFKKGHVITPEDLPELRRIGKEHVYILDLAPGVIHEDAAALRIARAVCGPGLHWSEPSEGKSTIRCRAAGLFQVNVDGLRQINRVEDVILSTLKTDFPCESEQVVAATRIIPLVTAESRIEKVEAIARQCGPILQVKAFHPLRFGAVVTGSEIYKGLIPDGFEAFVGRKAAKYGCRFVEKILVPDDPARIAAAVAKLHSAQTGLIIVTGGLSVDPDDVTVTGVRQTGAQMVVYGSPVLPGAMFLYARLGDAHILGLPACVFYHSVTIYDLVLPRILAGEEITAERIAEMGHGGLCMDCEVCHFPACPFGR
jgi:hypothetical protein